MSRKCTCLGLKMAEILTACVCSMHMCIGRPQKYTSSPVSCVELPVASYRLGTKVQPYGRATAGWVSYSCEGQVRLPCYCCLFVCFLFVCFSSFTVSV